MKKQLGWACQLDRTESLAMSREGKQCQPGWWSLGYGNSLLALWLCGSIGGGFRQGTMACLSVWEKTVPQLSPWWQILHFLSVCHWCLSSCYASAFSSERANLSKTVCGFFKGNCLGLQTFLPLTLSQLAFAARSYIDLSSWHWNLGLEGLGQAGTPRSEISFPNFYPPHVDVGPTCSSSLLSLPVWMDVVSLIL